jgi:hypothetical protein
MSKDGFLSDEAVRKYHEEAARDMEWAKREAGFIKELAQQCYLLRTLIEAFIEYAGPYAQPFIDAQLEGILGVYRKKEDALKVPASSAPAETPSSHRSQS